MKNIFLFFAVLVGISCFCSVSWAGTAHKMIDKDYGTLYGEQAVKKLAELTRQNLERDSTGLTPYPASDSFHGCAPIHLYTAFRKAGYYKDGLASFPEYLDTLVMATDFDRSKTYNLSRFIKRRNGEKFVDFGFRRKIDRNNGKEIAFADPQTGKLVIAGNCMNVILDGEKVYFAKDSGPKIVASNIPLCRCEGKGKAVLPLKLRSNYENETVSLNFPQQKRILLFWMEDAKGRKVYLPEAQLEMTDENQNAGNEMNYPSLRFDASTCTAAYIKWWDRVDGADRGKVHKSGDVLLNNGTIKVSVLAENFQSNSFFIPWKVIYSELREEKRAKNPDSKGITSFLSKITGKGKIQTPEVKGLETSFSGETLSGKINVAEDRLIEVVSFDGQLNWVTVARHGKFEIKNIPNGEYLLQVFYFPKDDNKSRLKPKIEYEEIVSLNI